MTLAFRSVDSNPWFVPKSHVDRGEVTILRDAPEPPVTVRREDYDLLRETARVVGTLAVGALDSPAEIDRHDLYTAARALIDNAEEDS